MYDEKESKLFGGGTACGCIWSSGNMPIRPGRYHEEQAGGHGKRQNEAAKQKEDAGGGVSNHSWSAVDSPHMADDVANGHLSVGLAVPSSAQEEEKNK